MGSCISKFSSNKKGTQNFIQDKLVIISQPPISSNTIPPKPPSPSSSPTSSSSFSSFYYSTSTNTTSSSSSNNVPLSSSSSSCSSSTIFPKERPTTFSNDFLRSCVTQNPQINSRIFNDDVKEYRFDQNMEFDKICAKKLSNTSTPQFTKPIVASPRRYMNTPKKRSRAKSPNLARQKSFRAEIRPTTPSRIIRSQSPARRFSNSDHNCSYKATLINQITPTERHRQPLGSKRISWSEKENAGATSNCRSDVLSKNYGRSGENYISHRVKQEFPAAAAAADQQDIDSILMEDINNPHIALDCFIFL